MRLQPKKAIAADLATQRKAQIDEGVKIASKVDALRETLVQEEGNLERFRTESIAIVQADIDRYIDTKNNLISEVQTLERRKAEAQIPLDMEWEKLRQAEARFLRDKQAWGEKSDSLDERQSQIERAEVEVANEKERAADLKHRASVLLAEADETRKEAREVSAEIRNKAQAVLMAAEAKEQEVEIKKKEITKRVVELELVAKRQLTKEIEQAQHDKTIKDKYATLERTINRIGKHG